MSSEAYVYVNLFLLCYFYVVFAFLEFCVFISLGVSWLVGDKGFSLWFYSLSLSSFSLIMHHSPFPYDIYYAYAMSTMSIFCHMLWQIAAGTIFHYISISLSCFCQCMATKTLNYPPTQPAICSISLYLVKKSPLASICNCLALSSISSRCCLTNCTSACL
jgi:hypothetical protein